MGYVTEVLNMEGHVEQLGQEVADLRVEHQQLHV